MTNQATQSFFSKGRNGNTVVWKKKECEDWLKQYKKLVEIFAVLCHMLGGQPAYSSEFTTLRWRNTIDEDKEVYWINRTIMLVAMYLKT
jgi:hypothetical protein